MSRRCERRSTNSSDNSRPDARSISTTCEAIGCTSPARRRFAPRCFGAVRRAIREIQTSYATPSQGLRLPVTRPPIHPGQADQLRVTALDKVTKRPAGEIGSGHAVPDVATSDADSRRGVELHRRAPVARNTEHSRPRLFNGYAFRHRKETRHDVL